jgi:8-hydroxy-5-deazaflavin:NADPH oxidoreductase
MSTSPVGANKPIENIEPSLLAATKRHFGALPEEPDGLPSSAFVAKAFTGAKLVKALIT